MTCPSWIVGAASVILGLVEQWPYQTLLITVPVRKGSSGGPHTCDQILSAEVTDATYIHNLLARASPVAVFPQEGQEMQSFWQRVGEIFGEQHRSPVKLTLMSVNIGP